MRDWSVILCASCGYEVGDSTQGVCPECGTSRAKSHPSYRTGSPWQQAPTLRSFLGTLFWLLSHRAHAFDRILLDQWRAASLVPAFCALTGGLVWMGFVISENGSEFRSVLSLLGVVMISVLVLGSLSVIEYLGLRIIGVRRGYRVGHRVSAAVVGHASAGWVVGGLLGAAGWLVGSVLPDGMRDIIYKSSLWEYGVISRMPVVLRNAEFVLLVVGLLAGLFLFEWLAYAGLKRCKWANQLSAQSAETI